MKILYTLLILLTCKCSSRISSPTTKLDLSNQKLTSIPDSVFSLTQLTYLVLGNNFTLYPPLSGLAHENSSSDSLNRLESIPKEIEQLQSLKVLGLSFIGLKTLPDEMTKLKQLNTLDLSFNEHLNISETMQILKKMPWLKNLNLIATSIDQKNIDHLKKSLPGTKIRNKFDYEQEISIE